MTDSLNEWIAASPGANRTLKAAKANKCKAAYEEWYYKTTKPRAIGAKDHHYEARWEAWQAAWEAKQ